jgi:hypothetical protein
MRVILVVALEAGWQIAEVLVGCRPMNIDSKTIGRPITA